MSLPEGFRSFQKGQREVRRQRPRQRGRETLPESKPRTEEHVVFHRQSLEGRHMQATSEDHLFHGKRYPGTLLFLPEAFREPLVHGKLIGVQTMRHIVQLPGGDPGSSNLYWIQGLDGEFSVQSFGEDTSLPERPTASQITEHRKRWPQSETQQLYAARQRRS